MRTTPMRLTDRLVWKTTALDATLFVVFSICTILLGSVTHGDSLIPWTSIFLNIAVELPASMMFHLCGWHWQSPAATRPAIFPLCMIIISNGTIGALLG